MREDKYYCKEDEIDIYELWLVLKKRIKFIISFFLCVTILTWVILCLVPSIYETQFLIKIPVAPSEEEAEIPLLTMNEANSMIQTLSDLLEIEDYDNLQSLLRLKKSILKNLKKINCKFNKQQEYSFALEIETTCKKDIPILSKAIVDYLNRNQYVQKKLHIERDKLEAKKKVFLSKINEAKAIKRIIMSKIKDKKIELIGFNPTDMEKNIVDMELQLRELEISLRLLKGFEKITEPFIPNSPSRPKKLFIVILISIIVLFLGIFLSFFLEWLDRAKKERLYNN
jgi:capsular polysaccharide biosynthesis protein